VLAKIMSAHCQLPQIVVSVLAGSNCAIDGREWIGRRVPVSDGLRRHVARRLVESLAMVMMSIAGWT